jgi:hypothetical protein
LLIVEAVAQPPGEPAGSVVRVDSETGKSFVARYARLAARRGSAGLAPTSVSGQHLFRNAFVRQPPRMQKPLGPRPHLADASATSLLQAHSVPRDQQGIKVGSTFAHPLGRVR